MVVDVGSNPTLHAGSNPALAREVLRTEKTSLIAFLFTFGDVAFKCLSEHGAHLQTMPSTSHGVLSSSFTSAGLETYARMPYTACRHQLHGKIIHSAYIPLI